MNFFGPFKGKVLDAKLIQVIIIIIIVIIIIIIIVTYFHSLTVPQSTLWCYRLWTCIIQ